MQNVIVIFLKITARNEQLKLSCYVFKQWRKKNMNLRNDNNHNT